MSYFGTCLDELIKRKGIKAVDLARFSGVGAPMISRYRTGEQTWIDPQDLGKLARAISNDPREQAELLKARLLDECQGPGAELIRVEIGSAAELREKPVPYQVKLSRDLEQAFLILREWVMKDARVKGLVEDLAGLLSSPAPVGMRDQPPMERLGRTHEQEAVKRNRAVSESGTGGTAAAPESASDATGSTPSNPSQSAGPARPGRTRSRKGTRSARTKT
jgi:transcriptional regulator with XRE-family HTH domain